MTELGHDRPAETDSGWQLWARKPVVRSGAGRWLHRADSGIRSEAEARREHGAPNRREAILPLIEKYLSQMSYRVGL